jgi:hypothetical protein
MYIFFITFTEYYRKQWGFFNRTAGALLLFIKTRKIGATARRARDADFPVYIHTFLEIKEGIR